MSDHPALTDISGVPEAPSNPESASAFREAVTSNAEEWFAYIRTVDRAVRAAVVEYEALSRQLEATRTKAEEQRLRSEGAIEALRAELRHRFADVPAARLSERLADPDPFTGDRKDLRRFENAVILKLDINRDRFPTSRQRVAYVMSLCRSTAGKVVQARVVKGKDDRFEDFEDVLKVLQTAFGNPNMLLQAENDLFELRQKPNDDYSSLLLNSSAWP